MDSLMVVVDLVKWLCEVYDVSDVGFDASEGAVLSVSVTIPSPRRTPNVTAENRAGSNRPTPLPQANTELRSAARDVPAMCQTVRTESGEAIVRARATRTDSSRSHAVASDLHGRRAS
jgi:hypothetical protein